MIASLRGTCIDLGLTGAIIECAGVGYAISATPRTLGEMRTGEECFVVVSQIVREDSMELFAFANSEEKEFFHLLCTVSKVGPKLALAALAMATPAELAGFISRNDAAALEKIPGVGKRTAERMVVDLKQKVEPFVGPHPQQTQVDSPAISGGVAEDVAEALENLGFSRKDADAAVASVLAQQPDLGVSAALRACLATLSAH
ncbi:Holliday junction ATP-dependent DNA helicase RuvA [Corynebacterium ciconiae DSM 44920]|uniref:Holliday junction branch migration protein RuvA n=1 Tax=Corynebacterium ciconiae TaxID=227319 RepID=UPI000360662B|nr:Holliday junction branch migration protein RuvA [Corynebacterium ciconiae]WKD61338.1 Holliday junction ATP-dependent DNA helicase RuvA [Corynebacterium ciconiae DSM 44920]